MRTANLGFCYVLVKPRSNFVTYKILRLKKIGVNSSRTFLLSKNWCGRNYKNTRVLALDVVARVWERFTSCNLFCSFITGIKYKPLQCLRSSRWTGPDWTICTSVCFHLEVDTHWWRSHYSVAHRHLVSWGTGTSQR